MIFTCNSVLMRSMCAGIIALVGMLAAGNWFIAYAQRLFASGAREYLPEAHKAKAVTPTMGGALMAAAIIIVVSICGSLADPLVLLSLGVLVAYALLGGIDDWYKVRYKSGIYARTKSRLQITITVLMMGLWVMYVHPDTAIYLPVFKSWHINLWWPLFIVWGSWVIIGCSNAVNLTDGLDGLATSSLIFVYAAFAVIAYCVGDSSIAACLLIPSAPVAELAVVASAAVGTLVGFLWFNRHPARIFMGDVGSLSLGGLLGFIALATKQEALLAIAGGVFVIETVSVVIQVGWYRLRKQRMFKMAPIHHHFELCGIPESQITVRFAIASLLLSIVAIILLIAF